MKRKRGGRKANPLSSREMALDHVLSHPEEYEEDPEFDKFCDKVISALEDAKKKVLE